MARDRISSVPTYWAGRIRESGMRQLRGGDRAIAGEEIVERDTERTRARQERLGEARPGVPAALYALILVAVTMALGLIAVITASGVAPGVHVVVVVAASMLFTSTLLLIRDLDQPYSGATGREPTQTEFVRAQMQDDLTGTLPCDARGLPTRDPAFRLATSPLR